jgi:phosphoribosylglycinamide formyltransferase-1
MRKPSHAERCLARLSKICLALPEATREVMGRHAAFIVRKKKFVYFLDDHHGDGILSVCAKALPGDNVRLVSANPERFYLPAYVGPRGWVALHLDRGDVDWDEVTELVVGSYLAIAPRTLATLARDLSG